MALFSATIVINPKRQGLQEGGKISDLHNKIGQCLQYVMQRERPQNPKIYAELMGTLNDLWILNDMHWNQTQMKLRMSNRDASENTSLIRQQPDSPNSHMQSYPQYSEIETCPVRYMPEYEDEGVSEPTYSNTPLSPDDETRSPDSGCSIESGFSSDSEISISSQPLELSRKQRMYSDDHSEISRSSETCALNSKMSIPSHNTDYPTRDRKPIDDREVLQTLDDQVTEGVRRCHIKRRRSIGEESALVDNKRGKLPSPDEGIRMCPIKRNGSVDEDSSVDSDTRRQLSWNKSQKVPVKSTDSPVLRRCLESPSTLKMQNFCDYFKGERLHHHKKFRPVPDRNFQTHETLESNCPSPRSSSTTPSSSISSSPSRMSASPYSPLSSSPSTSVNASLLANRLQMPAKSVPIKKCKTSYLLQSLTQETTFDINKVNLSEQIHECIINGQSRMPRPHVMAAPSPSRYDDMRSTSSVRSQSSHMSSPSPSHLPQSSPPHNYHIPPAHSPPSSTPTGLGACAMSGASSPYYNDDAQPLNLSTKTPSPPPQMET